MLKVKIINKSKINLHGLKPEGEMLIDVDKYGTPKERLWRKRKADALHDGCIEIVTEKKKEIIKKSKEDKI